jgi:hypothetical protein
MLSLIKEPGRIPKHPFRDIGDAILYIDRSRVFLAAQRLTVASVAQAVDLLLKTT